LEEKKEDDEGNLFFFTLLAAGMNRSGRISPDKEGDVVWWRPAKVELALGG
jgi:hypothetical protein